MSSKAADAIEARGMKKGAVPIVDNIVKKFNISLSEACEIANITIDDYKKYSDK